MTRLYSYSDINIYGVICIANRTYDTPNEAIMSQFENDAANMGIDESTPVYTWKADESNEICCFLTPHGIVMERMYLKNGRYYSTGWMNGCEYGKDSLIDGELSFYTVKQIKPSGLYGGNIQFALFCGEDRPPECTVVLSFPAEGETYSIVTP